MKTTEITKEELNLFAVCAKHYLNNYDGDRKANPLVRSIESILPGMMKQLKKVERQKELSRVSLCKKTASKHIEYDKSGRYQFTEEDFKKLEVQLDKIDQEKIKVLEVVIEEFPEEGLSYDIRQAFEGIVIPKTEKLEIVEELEEELEEKDEE